MVQKGLESSLLDQEYLFFAEFFLSGIGGYPPPPNLDKKNPLSSIWRILLENVKVYPPALFCK